MLQNRPQVGGGQWTIYYYQKDPPFLSGGSPPTTRFALPTTREKTSLNARDWWKGKELFI